MSKLSVNTIAHTGGTTGITINSAGVVTQPTKPMFKVDQSTDQTISHATPTTVEFNNLSHVDAFDIGSYFNTSNYRYIPQVAGYYFFATTVTIQSSVTDYVIVFIRKNGVSQYRNLATDNPHNGHLSSHVSGIIQLNGSSDYVDVQVQHNAGSSKDTHSNFQYSNFSGFLIG